MDKHKGIFVISLDFELYWGVRDKRSLTSYGDAITNVKKVIPRLLTVFKEYGIHATFSTVGFLFAKDKEELLHYSPQKKPDYKDSNLSPYTDDFSNVGENESMDSYHYALELIEMIKADGNHDIGSHTYSHFYCLEEGQTLEDFKEDMTAAVNIAKARGVELRSVVFPRNQYNSAYRQLLQELGIQSYRGNERVWFHSYQSEENTNLVKRIFRTANCYVNLAGHHCYALDELKEQGSPFDIPSSRFLRPFQPKYPFLTRLQLRRVKNSMTHAAKNGLLYHLWWHPHNFGRNRDDNFKMLEDILQHYKALERTYGFESKSMEGMSSLLLKQKDQ